MKYFIILFFFFAIYSCNKPGCTNINANNFNEKAKEDDGSCDFTTHYAFYFTDSLYDANGDTMMYGFDSIRISFFEQFATTVEALGDRTIYPGELTSCNSPGAVVVTSNTILWWGANVYKDGRGWIGATGNLTANGQSCRLINLSEFRFD